MDAKFINPVLNSMVNVLSTMANVNPKPGKLVIKEDEVALGIVTSIIKMDGEHARGSLAISFTKDAILDITERMLQEKKTDIDNEIKDLTGEMANMVLGGAKTQFKEEGYDFGLTTPDVLSGKDHIVHHPYPGPKVVLPFTMDSGNFYVEICFKD